MILVTGATGLIGAHLTAHLLLQNKELIALKRPNSKTENIKEILSFYTPDYNTLFSKIKFVDGDVTDIFSILDALEGVARSGDRQLFTHKFRFCTLFTSAASRRVLRSLGRFRP